MADIDKIKFFQLLNGDFVIALTDGKDSAGTRVKLIKPCCIVPTKDGTMGLMEWPMFRDPSCTTIWLNLNHVTVQCKPEEKLLTKYNIDVHGGIAQAPKGILLPGN